MRVVVAGASGLIGSALRAHLTSQGHDVVQLVRRPPTSASEIQWAPERRELGAGTLDGADVVVNLSGVGIGDKRWTRDYKNELIASRVAPTSTLAEAIAAMSTRPVFLSSSASGFYGDRGDELLNEDASSGTLFLSEVCRQWEAATKPAADAGGRVVLFRTGVVLTPEGGALKRQLPLFKLGLGGRFGSGKQWLSWIALGDEVRAIEYLMTSDVEGPVNLCAPTPVTGSEFAKTLGRVLGRPALLPIPSFGPGLLFGSELVNELLLASQRAQPTVLAASGFTFLHSTLEDALRSMLDKPAA